MKKLFVLFFLISSVFVHAQVPQPAMLSLRGIGGSGGDVIVSNVTKTTDGGFIIHIESNSIPGTGNIDSFCSPVDKREIFIKYSSDASIAEWSKCYGFGGDSFLSYLFPTGDLKYVLGGMYYSTIAGGLLICKQDSLGNTIWKKDYSKGNGAGLRAMIATSDGGYLIVGESYYTDSNVVVHYGDWMDADIWLLKLDSNGNKVWSKVIGGSKFESPQAIVETSGDCYYLIGATGSNDYDCTGNHGGDNDMYIVRLDKNGNIIWHKDFGGSGNDGGKAATVDSHGGIIVAGNTNSTDGDVSHATVYNGGIWIVNIDSAGNKIWDNCYGGAYCYPNAICRGVDGTLWIVGVASHTGLKIDTTFGHDDAWILHIDSVGNFLNAKVLGGTMDDRGTMIHSLPNGNTIIGGAYGINSGLFSSLDYYYSNDAFLAVFAPWDQTAAPQIPMAKNAFSLYPNPALNLITIELKINGACAMEVCDVYGKTVYKTTVNSRKQIIVKDWRRGVYCVHVTGEEGYRATQILVVQ